MKPSANGTSPASRKALGAFAVTATAFAAAAMLPGCGADCEELKEDIGDFVKGVQACSAGDTCVVIAAENDCTGILACPFAVNASRVDEARSEATRFADESQDCSTCAVTECPVTGTPVCDADEGYCILQ